MQISPDIEPLHAKIIVESDFGDIGIEDISLTKGILKEKHGKKYKLKKRRDYEIFPGRKFYITKNIGLTLFQGKNKEIEHYLEELNMEHLKDYLYTKKPTLFDQNNENEIADDSNLPLEFEHESRVNTEDFNNFDYIPMDDEYLNDELRKYKLEDEKILKEVLEAPNNLGEIINNTNNKTAYLHEDERLNIDKGIHQEIDQMLTQRLTRKQYQQYSINENNS